MNYKIKHPMTWFCILAALLAVTYVVNVIVVLFGAESYIDTLSMVIFSAQIAILILLMILLGCVL